SADSRQCFKELDIGVAKPSAAELAAVPHYFINSHSIHDNFSAADYESYALEKLSQIFREKDIAVMVGGTGLYIKAFAEGLDAIPAIDEAIKLQVAEGYAAMGISWLQSEIQQHDPAFYASGEIRNPHRLIRALEVKLSTGKSITELQSRTKKTRDFNIVKIGMEMPREKLYSRINDRVDQMMADGLEIEALALMPFRELNALQTVGYRELFDFFDGKISLDKAVELIKQNTRHYAKRQMTWFKKDEIINWVNADTPITAEVKRLVKK
ncbi:MAG: tRNA (adenosine(37)-N6)-dimethylallyltransferase MiaA, partial [Pedobacter sp.]